MPLQHVDILPIHFDAYDELANPELLQDIRVLAQSLRGLRVVHVSATPVGGGVAELLHSVVPLMQNLGLDASWYVLPPDDDFFAVTKRMHNCLQGNPGELTGKERETYLSYLERLAASMRSMDADVWVIHDPQPLPLLDLVPLAGATVWRCHIDCSMPNAEVRDYLLRWVHGYDRAVFSMPDYAPAGLSAEQITVVHPAIDPLTPKNRSLTGSQVADILAGLGIDPGRPLVTQVSRFDPWKNPWQVVDTYRLAKREAPDLQLALVGVFDAKDDPEGPKIYRSIREQVGQDPDVHLFTDPSQVGQREVNAFQSGSRVMLQRSTREGFGLSVAEAMWKARPVVATPVGGITAQIQHLENGYLVSSTEECGDCTIELLRRPGLADSIGNAARQRVRDAFLLPRLVRDDLELYAELTRQSEREAVA